MFLFSKLLQAVRTWRRGRRPKPAKRAGVSIEQLDHRQLLSVNFTGNVPVDFPATQSPGVAIIPVPQSVQPTIPASLQPYIHVSGFSVSDIRVSYNAADDTLSLGLDAPPSGNAGQGEVIAGDADDNGNPGTVNPSVTGVSPGFMDFPDFTGSEYMGAILGFTGPNTPQIVAGFSEVSPIAPTPSNPIPAKPYQVAVANLSNLPMFGTELPQFEGSYFLPNSPTAPNLEFTITHFSQLYQAETGTPMTPNSVIYVGTQAGSSNDGGINELFFPPTSSFTIASATLPGTCPPQSPTIYVNPHEHRIVDTLHRDLIRVTILGTSGFHVQDINPSTVTLDGVHAVAHITRKVRRDEFPMATYVFVADQLNLAPGLNNVTLSGTLKNGLTTFTSSKAVLNIPNAERVSGPLHHYMGGGSIYKALSRIEAKHPGVAIPSSNATVVSVSRNPAAKGLAKLKVSYAPVVSAVSQSGAKASHAPKARPVVSIPKHTDAHSGASTKLPTLLNHSMSDYLQHA
jgi:hypothetical protein